MAEYRIDFTLQRRADGGDFEDIGFGSSGAWDDPASSMSAPGDGRHG